MEEREGVEERVKCQGQTMVEREVKEERKGGQMVRQDNMRRKRIEMNSLSWR